jgi:hypothetical protein
VLTLSDECLATNLQITVEAEKANVYVLEDGSVHFSDHRYFVLVANTTLAGAKDHPILLYLFIDPSEGKVVSYVPQSKAKLWEKDVKENAKTEAKLIDDEAEVDGADNDDDDDNDEEEAYLEVCFFRVRQLS